MSIEGDNSYTASSSGLTYTPAETNTYDPVTLDIDSSGDSQSRSNNQHLMRAQWEDYQKRFAPIEDELIGQIGNADYYAGQVQNATDAVGDAYQNQAGMADRNLSRYGVATTGQQEADQQRQYGLDAAAATAQAANQTRADLKTRDIDIMSGGIVPNEQLKQGTS